MSYVILLVTSLLAGVTQAQFNPSCSFNDGQCMYQIELGHHGSCDKRQVSSGGGECCDTLQSQVTGLTDDVNTLKTQVSTLLDELMNSKNNLSQAKDNLSESERHTQQLLDTLKQKEAELNTTQTQLSNVLAQAGDEIRTLRNQVSSLTTQLNTCKGTLGLATNTSALPQSSILPSDVAVSFCDFEDHADGSDVLCGYKNASYHFYRGAGAPSSSTGPREDHTYGAPSGHYMFLDNKLEGAYTSSSRTRTMSMISPTFSPGPGYCIRFWYNMYGDDVKDLKVYAKIDAGKGYPIFQRTGEVGGDWHMAEADLDSEYTASSFQLVFDATTSTYHGTYSTFNLDGDIAIDDVYVYNTSCKNIPLCPAGGVTRDSGSTTSCYTFHAQPATWYEAATICRQQGATTSLVTVNSKDEQDFIVQTIKADTALSAAGQFGFYTAGNDEREEHTFDWTDTGTPYHGTYTDWKVGQPNNVASDQDCLLLQYPDLDYQWGDVDCDERHPFICKTQYPTASGSSAPIVG